VENQWSVLRCQPTSVLIDVGPRVSPWVIINATFGETLDQRRNRNEEISWPRFCLAFGRFGHRGVSRRRKETDDLRTRYSKPPIGFIRKPTDDHPEQPVVQIDDRPAAIPCVQARPDHQKRRPCRCCRRPQKNSLVENRLPRLGNDHAVPEGRRPSADRDRSGWLDSGVMHRPIAGREKRYIAVPVQRNDLARDGVAAPRPDQDLPTTLDDVRAGSKQTVRRDEESCAAFQPSGWRPNARCRVGPGRQMRAGWGRRRHIDVRQRKAVAHRAAQKRRQARYAHILAASQNS
jgi:hypothetical protein